MRNQFADAMKSREVPWRAILDWYMCSDPFPEGVDHAAITEWLNAACRAGGYDSWVDAYHELER